MNMFLNDKALAERFGVGRSTIWKWVGQGLFPRPVSLSPRCTRWRLSEVEEWEAAKHGKDGKKNGLA